MHELSIVSVLEVFGAVMIGLFLTVICNKMPGPTMKRGEILSFIFMSPLIWVAFIMVSPVIGIMFVGTIWDEWIRTCGFRRISEKARAIRPDDKRAGKHGTDAA
jgi:hypothetical protein